MNATHHIAFNCKDRAAQERFYTKLLGFRRARVFNAGTPDEFVMLRLGSTCIELFQAKGLPASAQASEQPLGFKHMAFEVPDIEAKVAEVSAAGIETQSIIDCSSVVPGLRICFFRDPEGNLLELMQGWSDDESLPPR